MPIIPRLRRDSIDEKYEAEDGMNFIAAVTASIIISLISLIGVVTLILKDKTLKSLLLLLIGLSAGALIGGAFLHILPETIAKSGNSRIVLKELFY